MNITHTHPGKGHTEAGESRHRVAENPREDFTEPLTTHYFTIYCDLWILYLYLWNTNHTSSFNKGQNNALPFPI